MLMALLSFLLLNSNRQLLTGDEPRYLIYAVSFIRHGVFVMQQSEWSRLSWHVVGHSYATLPTGAGGVFLMNGVYIPMLLSPIAGLLKLWGLRMATLLVGIGGLFCLYRMLRRVAGPLPALASLAIAAFSIPLLPYLHLFYMETFVFALVCWAWLRLQTHTRSLSGDLLTTLVIVSIPFAHLRGAGVAALLFAGLLSIVIRKRLWARAATICLIVSIGGLAFVLLNLSIYGAVTGPVNTARPPLPTQWFSVLSMQLFNVHHGLFAYAPVWVLGYAGLWASLGLRGGAGFPIARQALILATAAALTGVGVNPGECWPARFWVLSVPMLSVGLCVWMERARGITAAACFVLLLLATLTNTVFFFKMPNIFLENRQTSTTYDALFDRFGHLDANVLLPVENDDDANRIAAEELALGTGVFILLMALALRYRAASIPALLLLFATIDLARVHRVRDPIVTASLHRLRIDLPSPVKVVTIEIGHGGQTWFAPPDYPRFQVTTLGRNGNTTSLRAADQDITVVCGSGVHAIDITTDGMDLRAQAAYRLRLLATSSLLRPLIADRGC
ncbi:MAG: hypothetical protein ACRYGI_07550 [Janthinobacterium lividum]